jgi:hypothetical protein
VSEITGKSWSYAVFAGHFFFDVELPELDEKGLEFQLLSEHVARSKGVWHIWDRDIVMCY